MPVQRQLARVPSDSEEHGALCLGRASANYGTELEKRVQVARGPPDSEHEHDALCLGRAKKGTAVEMQASGELLDNSFHHNTTRSTDRHDGTQILSPETGPGIGPPDDMAKSLNFMNAGRPFVATGKGTQGAPQSRHPCSVGAAGRARAESDSDIMIGPAGQAGSAPKSLGTVTAAAPRRFAAITLLPRRPAGVRVNRESHWHPSPWGHGAGRDDTRSAPSRAPAGRPGPPTASGAEHARRSSSYAKELLCGPAAVFPGRQGRRTMRAGGGPGPGP